MAQTIVYPRYEVYGGASLQPVSGGGGDRGANFSFTKYRNRWFGWEVNGAAYGARSYETGFKGKSQFLTFGPHLVDRGGRLTTHLRALAGISHYNAPIDNSVRPIVPRSDTGLAWQVGVGIEGDFGRYVGWRVLQIDVIRVNPPNPTSFEPSFQISIVMGFVFKWGGVDE